ncbi:uncharacterized protein KNAG_0C02260 [Huiozyma naganishii CBS 8797]|uniref:Uncharacterized protein n=1 Tax=Huiozyma naganishii (strain ATCC MYA-139 / BCRC 22969 / CBS 8797 / KCTC 17520 / NBRC 10181 / NCYC 3082 / Yp74L-3) TaxID=1071383 RepID=J7RWF6_HUIN7|nr:hypothetical protein KNAG_0C02260 [Kazachstania naganishii CBS 8797]CCK69337.1 hypothetical protein KNAG_0C02260 [Kazachstania naganishii CBS 8797]
MSLLVSMGGRLTVLGCSGTPSRFHKSFPNSFQTQKHSVFVLVFTNNNGCWRRGTRDCPIFFVVVFVVVMLHCFLPAGRELQREMQKKNSLKGNTQLHRKGRKTYTANLSTSRNSPPVRLYMRRATKGYTIDLQLRRNMRVASAIRARAGSCGIRQIVKAITNDGECTFFCFPSVQ